MTVFKIDHVTLEIEKGVTFHTVFREALILALTGQHVIHFTFNDRLHIVNPYAILELLEKQSSTNPKTIQAL